MNGCEKSSCIYMERPEDCPVIMKKKCQKIYDSLSDSDKLLLELDLDYD